jgi:MYXO-CTERM domain-containing protein
LDKPEHGSPLPGVLVAGLGGCLLVAGVSTGGPDAVGGIVFGGVFLLAGAVILRRRSG